MNHRSFAGLLPSIMVSVFLLSLAFLVGVYLDVCKFLRGEIAAVAGVSLDLTV